MDADFPSPKSQDHAVGKPAESSLKYTVNGAFPDSVDVENWAFGGEVELLVVETTIVLVGVAVGESGVFVPGGRD